MTRISLVLVIALSLSILSSVQTSGQVSTLAAPDAILRLEESETWMFRRTVDGIPWVVDNHQMQDGVPLVEMNPSTLLHYEEHQVQDVFAFYAEVLPISYAYESVATTVQTRVISFPDATSAEGYLNSVLDAQHEAVAMGEIEDRLFTPVDPLPEYPHPLVGWSSVSTFVQEETGEPGGYASGVRYHAQIDNIIVSAEAIGPFVDFNFDLAYWLLDGQAFCVQQETPCEAVTVPMGSADWLFIGDALYFAGSDGGEGSEARWVYPVEGPVVRPDYSATIPPG